MMLLGFFVLILLFAWIYWYYVTNPFYEKGSESYHQNRRQFMAMGDAVRLIDFNISSNRSRAFSLFFEEMRKMASPYVGDEGDDNPFPKCLPAGHMYSRLEKYPIGVQPELVPLMWDVESGPRGLFAVLMCDGNVPEGMTEKHLNELVVNAVAHSAEYSHIAKRGK